MYENRLRRLRGGQQLLADYPEFVEPLQADERFEAPPLLADKEGDLVVRAWRYWYNARGIVEMENRLNGRQTALIIVHPWGVDDGSGLQTPEPAGCAFFCTPEKNQWVGQHIKHVLNPLLARLRPRIGLIAYSLPGVEDEIRQQLYASVRTAPENLNPAAGEQALAALLREYPFCGEPLVEQIPLDSRRPVSSYMAQTPSTDASARYNGRGFWDLPMPVHAALDRAREDIVFYDGEGYPLVRDYLRQRGIRHVLLCGYATDMCVKTTTCGYVNLSQDFNVFVVGDATLATFPASHTPRFATQVALCNIALTQLVTQASWIY